jgi:hypothetical protein
MDDDCSGPQLFGAGARCRNRSGAIHSGRLRRVDIKLVRMNDAYAVMPPFRFRSSCHFRTSGPLPYGHSVPQNLASANGRVKHARQRQVKCLSERRIP